MSKGTNPGLRVRYEKNFKEKIIESVRADAMKDITEAYQKSKRSHNREAMSKETMDISPSQATRDSAMENIAETMRIDHMKYLLDMSRTDAKMWRDEVYMLRRNANMLSYKAESNQASMKWLRRKQHVMKRNLEEAMTNPKSRDTEYYKQYVIKRNQLLALRVAGRPPKRNLEEEEEEEEEEEGAYGREMDNLQEIMDKDTELMKYVKEMREHGIEEAYDREMADMKNIMKAIRREEAVDSRHAKIEEALQISASILNPTAMQDIEETMQLNNMEHILQIIRRDHEIGMYGELPLEYFRIYRALTYAKGKHKGQKRKNAKGNAYIEHPKEVAVFLYVHGIADTTILMSAMLHDTIEDTDATYEEIETLFGKEVADVVAEVSDDKSLPKLERKKLQLSTMASKSFAARMVKIADKISNTKDLLTDPPIGWTAIQINGYILWAQACCDQAMSAGDTPVKMEKAVREHFEMNLKTVDMHPEELELYYKSLQD